VTSNPLILVELCAGTAALTFHVAYRRRPITTLGSKLYLADALVRAFDLDRAPDHAVWIEPGEWGRTWRVLLVERKAVEVGAVLRSWIHEDARELFDRLRSSPPSADPVQRAAAFCYLQCRNYNGKPVSPIPDGTGWMTHGFDPEYRVTDGPLGPSSHQRGWATPRPMLTKRISAVRLPFPVDVRQIRAQEVDPIPGSIAFLDPPYRNRTSPYPHLFPREEVCTVAERWAAAGCQVGVSEAEPLRELGAGWEYLLLEGESDKTFDQHEEWLTLYRKHHPPRQMDLWRTP
jgi:site-specific DNA-adenine methylase